jgi:hypothetical protein
VSAPRPVAWRSDHVWDHDHTVWDHDHHAEAVHAALTAATGRHRHPGPYKTETEAGIASAGRG